MEFNEFIVGQKEYSIQINQIKELLDTYEIAYTDGATGTSTSTSNSNDAEETEEPDASTEEETTGEAEEEKATEPDADLLNSTQRKLQKLQKLTRKIIQKRAQKCLMIQLVLLKQLQQIKKQQMFSGYNCNK